MKRRNTEVEASTRAAVAALAAWLFVCAGIWLNHLAAQPGYLPSGITGSSFVAGTRPGMAFPVFGGDGRDGVLNVTGNTTLTFTKTGKQHKSVNVAAGVVLTLATDSTTYGKLWWGVQEDFTLGAGATITLAGLGSVGYPGATSTATDADGAAAQSNAINQVAHAYAKGFGHGYVGSVGSGGGGGGAASTRKGGTGGHAVYNPAGGGTGGGAGGTAGNPGSAANTYRQDPIDPDNWYMFPTIAMILPANAPGGGAGGGNGGGRGGYGGASAGSLWLEINGRALGAGTITAPGTNAPAMNDASNTGPGKGATNMGSGGGGAGGSGGKIVVAYRSGSCGWTLTAPCGSGAAGATAPTGGFAGGSGSSGANGRVKAWKAW